MRAVSDADRLGEKTDRQLYVGKRRGRNRVEVDDSDDL
jgi:PleD family two-component response regulator